MHNIQNPPPMDLNAPPEEVWDGVRSFITDRLEPGEGVRSQFGVDLNSQNTLKESYPGLLDPTGGLSIYCRSRIILIAQGNLNT